MLKKVTFQIAQLLLLAVSFTGIAKADIDAISYNNISSDPLYIADPHVLKHNGMYYLYGTRQTLDSETSYDQGFMVYTSKDLVNWSEPAGVDNGYALTAKNSWGNKMFWAPEVIYHDGKFIMYYTVQERLAIAVSDSPLGPFKQKEQKPLHLETPEIDPHVFIDDNGKAYFYFVRFTNGNEIWCAEMNDDLMGIKEDTIKHCIGQEQDWEKSKHYPGKVNEGAFMIKHKGWYYLTYSANHFRSNDYGVGYALSNSPTGPWKKYENNPILQSNAQVHGAGHHCLVKAPNDDQWFIVYHTHCSLDRVQPRKLAIDRLFIAPASNENDPDILVVKGPTITPQPLP